jgi:hypothetical protein
MAVHPLFVSGLATIPPALSPPPTVPLKRAMTLTLRMTARLPRVRSFIQPDCELAVFISQYDADNVEAASGSSIARQAPHVTLRDRQDVHFLGGIDGHLRRGEARVRLRLHFDEAQYAMVPSNQIDLAPVVRRAEVLGDDAIALVPEMEVSFHLATAGSHKMLRLRLSKMASGGVQRT